MTSGIEELRMINTLDDYIWRSLPAEGDFITNPNLAKKVSAHGKMLPYYGNTVVFLLNDRMKAYLKYLQELLYQAAGWMLAEPLQEATFHMTLHDLINGPEVGQLHQKMVEAEAATKRILAQWKDLPPLRMKTTWLFNMVNTSLVLGLAPTDDVSYRQLDNMYRTLETVVPLGYGLTPHITMAYFRPGTYSQWELKQLRQALGPVEMEMQLSMEQLVLQTFQNMNSYMTIL